MKEFLTSEEVSKLCKIKIRQVKELARQGKIPAIKVGKLWRFPEDSLRDWVEKGLNSNNHQKEIDLIANQIISEVS